MANQLNVRPIVIDTTMATPANLKRPIKVNGVYWYKPADVAGGDTFVIDDASTAANVLLKGQNEAQNQSQNFNFTKHHVWKNFKVTFTGASPGVLYIYTIK